MEPVQVRVEVARQAVEVRRGEEVLWSAPVSTAAAGCGETEGSWQTPRGWHSIAEKIGAGAPVGTVFKSRQATGSCWTPDQGEGTEDMILTRILWLAGEEPNNANSRQRYIYFHGTNQESQIGTPSSHGCIRLRNADMLALFDYVQVGTRVEIKA